MKERNEKGGEFRLSQNCTQHTSTQLFALNNPPAAAFCAPIALENLRPTSATDASGTRAPVTLFCQSAATVRQLKARFPLIGGQNPGAAAIALGRSLSAIKKKNGDYPPYNIEQSDETHYRITVAVAGFKDKDLSIETRNGVLTVSGRNEETSQTNFLYRGIAGRHFERSFQLAEHVEVRGATLENGLLQIDLERVFPEEMKPRSIAINGAQLKSIEGSKAA